MRRLFWLLLTFACVACPKPPPKPVVEPKVVDPLDAARETVEALYAAVEAGDADRLEPLFTDDALVFGLGPSDTWEGGTLIVDRARQTLLPIGLAGDTVKVDDTSPVVALAANGDAAWAFDLLRVTTTHKGRSEVWLPRLTLHLVREGDGFRIDALHVSLSVPDALVFAPDAAKRLLAPADVTNTRSADSEQPLGVVRRTLDDYALKVDRTSERPEFIQLGTSGAEVFIGGKAFKDLLKPQLGAIKKAGYSWKLDGNIRVKISPGGRSCWAAAVVVQRQGTGKKQQVFPAFRVLWTLEEEGGVWNVSSEHQSLAVKEELRAPATDEQVSTWKVAREAARKAQRTAPKPKAEPAAADAGAKPPPDIGAW